MKKFSVVALGLLACSALTSAPAVADSWEINKAGAGFLSNGESSAYLGADGAIYFDFGVLCNSQTFKNDKSTLVIDGIPVKMGVGCQPLGYLEGRQKNGLIMWYPWTDEGQAYTMGQFQKSNTVYIDGKAFSARGFSKVKNLIDTKLKGGI